MIITSFLVLFSILGVSSALFLLLILLRLKDLSEAIVNIGLELDEVCSPGVKQRKSK
jgi:hypothetical protein